MNLNRNSVLDLIDLKRYKEVIKDKRSQLDKINEKPREKTK